jgi:septal ring-binding cell division protein DamX
MKAMKILLLLSLIFIVGCQPSEGAIQTALAQTQAAIPTTADPPTVTVTISPTLTDIPTTTKTNTPTKVPTRTPTATLDPAMKTAIYKAQQATKKAQDATATKAVASLRKTSTAQAKAGTATEIASFLNINVKELVTYPKNHIGEKIKIRGRIFNINSNQEFQMWVGGSYDPVYVYMLKTYDDLYEDNYVTVYGMVADETCGKNSYGAEVCQPLIMGSFYEK